MKRNELPEQVRRAMETVRRGFTENLSLTSLGLTEVPPEIFALRSLRSLNLSYNSIQTVPEALRELTNLDNLNLHGNELDEIPAFFADLRLTSLHLGDNRFNHIPQVVFSIPSLRVLDFAGNRIEAVPKDILKLQYLKSLGVERNCIKTPPLEIVKKGISAIKVYWRQRDENVVDYLTEAKLLIVGEPGAGKTSLAKKLQDPSYRIQPTETSTEGIEVLPWTFPSSIRVTSDGREQVLNREFRANIWDFGGQEIYHQTHQFFLTRRSVYALVADDRKEDTDFNYWLQVVELLSDGSPLLIIHNENQDRHRDIDLNNLRARFRNLKDALRVNLADNRGLEGVVRAVRNELERLPHIGAALPQTWRRVREALEADPRNYISIEEYLNTCQLHGFKRPQDKLQLSGYLHDLGIFLHFQADPVLKSIVVLKPKWGTDAVYHVLDDRTVFEHHGRFGPPDLERIWRDPEYAGRQHELLRLMMRFQLCYQLPDSDTCIAPQLLPSTTPVYSWPETGNLLLRYEYGFMPKGLLTRLIVALNHRIADQHLVWRSGAIFQRDGTRVEVIEDYPRRRITLRANGPDARGLVAIIDDHLDQIHASFSQLKLEKYLPCNCPVCQIRPEPSSFSLTDLKDFACSGDLIQCRISRKMVDAAALVRELFPGAICPLPHAIVLDTARARQVFVSYKQADESIRLVDQVEAVLKDHGIVVRRDLNEVAYLESFREFMQSMAAADAIIVILSKEYLQSASCMFELTEVAAHGRFRERIFPVVLPGTDIHDPIDRITHIKYWDQRIRDLKAAMEGLDPTNLTGIQRDLNEFTRYRATIDANLDILRDMKTITGSNVKDLVNTLEKRLTV